MGQQRAVADHVNAPGKARLTEFPDHFRQLWVHQRIAQAGKADPLDRRGKGHDLADHLVV